MSNGPINHQHPVPKAFGRSQVREFRELALVVQLIALFPKLESKDFKLKILAGFTKALSITLCKFVTF